jgi:hypothetical protein
MVATERAAGALAVRPFPGLDTAVIARLHPRDRLPCRVTRCGQRDCPQPAILQAPRDAVDAAGLRLEHALEQRAKRRRIDETPRPRQWRSAARQQTSAPSRGARRQIAQIDAEHILDMQVAPDVYEVLEFPGKRLLMRSQICRVDSAGRHAGQNVRGKVGKRARQMPENPDLVRGARTAAGEHESQIRPLVRNAHSLCRNGLQAENTRSGLRPERREPGLSPERFSNEREQLLGHGIVWRADVVVDARVRGLASRDDLRGNSG